MDPCAFETKVLEAAHRGELPVDLAAHAASCATCAETLLVASFLGEETKAEVPPPGLVYWKAELRARRDQAERAMRPMRAMEMAALILLCAVAVGLGAMSGSWVLPAIGVGFVAAVGGLGWVVKTYLVRG
ncbi:MAG: hypothetical protein JST93_28980 [Acidobacteria bacterium]|nr:hypothetical protein [Acidobacteriota bacterium]